MTGRILTPLYSVSPQLPPEAMNELATAGFKTVICNRPDGENPPELQASVMREAAEAAGLTFHDLPITHQTMTPEAITRQAQIIAEADGPVLAYCASGTRSTIIWALGQVEIRSVDEILSMAAAAGYDLSGLRSALESL